MVEETEEQVFQFENDVYLAKIIVYQGRLTLALNPHDERLPRQEKQCASLEAALCEVFNAGESTGTFRFAMAYVTDHLEP